MEQLTEQQQQQELFKLMQEQRDQEQIILDRMLDKGLSFDVPKRSILKYFSKDKKRLITIYKPFLGTMDYLADARLKLNINDSQLTGVNIMYEKNVIIKDNSTLMCRIIAIAWLNCRWKIKLFTGVLAWYFKGRLDSQKIKGVTALIEQLENAAPFISSIVSTSGNPRATEPKADTIEEKQ